ncbi:MAG: pilus assembly protein PilM, partial [Planctomycetota bacterium]
IDKRADINELLITGNTVKMPGLAAYLGKNLGYEVHVIDRFNRLEGEDVLSIPTFRDNASTFAVCYGLCLQGLRQSQVHTSLVPQEILTQRLVRAKKPWALAGLAALMIGTTAQYALTQQTWKDTDDGMWRPAASAVTQMSDHSSAQMATDGTLTSQLTFLNRLGEEVSGNDETRLIWLEVLRAVNAAIPRQAFPDGIPSPNEVPLEDRIDIHVSEIETKYYEDLTTWYTERLAERYRSEMKNWVRVMEKRGQTVSLPEGFAEDTGPVEDGWVIQLRGYHYYNSPERMGLEGSNHVRAYLTTNFLQKEITLIDTQGNPISFTPAEFGFSYPLLLDEAEPKPTAIPNPDYDPAIAMMVQSRGPQAGQPPGRNPADEEVDANAIQPSLMVDRLDFTFQVVWKESMLSERIEAKIRAAEEAAAQAGLDDSVAAN